MFSPIINKFKSIKLLMQNRWLRVAIQISVIIYCAIYLISSYLSTDRSLLNIENLKYGAIFASLLSSMVCACLGSYAWWLILKGIGQSVSLIESVRLHLRSNLAKYLPGYAWQIVSKAYLSRQLGLTPGIIGLAMGIELIQLMLIGVGVTTWFVPSDLSILGEKYQSLAPTIPYIRVLVLIAIVTFIVLLPFMIRKIPANPQIVSFPALLWFASLTILIAWVLLGFSFWFLGSAFLPLGLSDVPIFTFTLSISFTLGLVIIFIPGSIGVRESIMVFILAPYLTGSLAVIIATLSRMVLIFSEFTVIYLFELGSFLAKRSISFIQGNP